MTKDKDLSEKSLHDEWTTIYRHDFPPKTCEIPKLSKFDSEKDIIASAYKENLLPDYLLTKLDKPSEYESAGGYYKRLVQKYPCITRNVENEVDQDIIMGVYQDNGRSIYQVDFCNIEDGFVSTKSLSAQRIQLPADWGDPPLTTQRKSYRDPKKILGKDEVIYSKPAKKPKSELMLSAKIKEILQIQTGTTEYQQIIGLLGDHIVQGKYYGEIPLLPNEMIQ